MVVQPHRWLLFPDCCNVQDAVGYAEGTLLKWFMISDRWTKSSESSAELLIAQPFYQEVNWPNVLPRPGVPFWRFVVGAIANYTRILHIFSRGLCLAYFCRGILWNVFADVHTFRAERTDVWVERACEYISAVLNSRSKWIIQINVVKQIQWFPKPFYHICTNSRLYTNSRKEEKKLIYLIHGENKRTKLNMHKQTSTSMKFSAKLYA